MEQVKKEGVIKYIYAKKNIKHEKLKIRVISDCMMPLIDVDDIVEVADFQKYRRGDIVAIYFNNQIYIHRIVKLKKNVVVTKGDRTFSADPESNNNQIIGIITRNLTKGNEIVRKRVVSLMIVKLSLLEAIIFERMKRDCNHRKLRYIYIVRKIIENMNLCFCIKNYGKVSDSYGKKGED